MSTSSQVCFVSCPTEGGADATRYLQDSYGSLDVADHKLRGQERHALPCRGCVSHRTSTQRSVGPGPDCFHDSRQTLGSISMLPAAPGDDTRDRCRLPCTIDGQRAAATRRTAARDGRHIVKSCAQAWRLCAHRGGCCTTYIDHITFLERKMTPLAAYAACTAEGIGRQSCSNERLLTLFPSTCWLLVGCPEDQKLRVDLASEQVQRRKNEACPALETGRFLQQCCRAAATSCWLLHDFLGSPCTGAPV